MQRRTSARVLAVCAALSMSAAACGDPEAESAASPLNELWGEPESQAEMRAKQLAQEEAVATCMKAEGWEYTPVDYTAQFNDQPEWIDPSTPGYGEKYGYGIVYGYEVYEWPYIDEDGNYAEDSPMGGGSFEDPNMEYVSGLSTEEQEQYYIALSGDWTKYSEPEIGEDGEEIWVSPPLEEQGCYGVAQQEVYGDQPWNDQEFSERSNELFEDLERDPAVEDAEITWSDCMFELDERYDFYGPEDTYTYVQNLLNEIRGMDPVEPMSESGDGAVPAATVVMGPGGSGQQRRPSEQELREVQAQEIELWKVDQECQDESGLREIRRQREQELVDTLREEFPDLVGRPSAARG